MAIAVVVTGIFLKNSTVGLTLIATGAGVLFAAVVMPAVSQVELGIPSGVKVTTAVRDREDKLRQLFEAQRPDLEICAKLLCNDSATANELLTAAMARATLDWRGPIEPQIRNYVLCWFVHRLMAHSRLAPSAPASSKDTDNPLSALTTVQRVIVVLNEFADVSIAELSDMVGLSPADTQAELKRGETALTKASNQAT